MKKIKYIIQQKIEGEIQWMDLHSFDQDELELAVKQFETMDPNLFRFYVLKDLPSFIDITKLTRYEAKVSPNCPFAIFSSSPNGAWVHFMDVQNLINTGSTKIPTTL